MRSDTDMINIYLRSVKPGSSVLQAMESYNDELASGRVNRAQELTNSLGNGDFEYLRNMLTKEVERYNLGDEYMAGMPHVLQGVSGSGPYGPRAEMTEKYATQLENYEKLKKEGLASYLEFLEKELAG